jgi:alkylation response protein AidB-like acyl-CoA dehydrogenase
MPEANGMNFEMNEQQKMIQELARKFARREIVPLIKGYERGEAVCYELNKKMASAGLLGLRIPVEYGGQGLDVKTSVIVSEELGWASVSLTTLATVGPTLPGDIISKFGTEEQKQKYLPATCSGEKIIAMGNTEPDAGSDGSAVRTSAVLEGGEWIINGNKSFISAGVVADTVLVVCSTDRTKGPRGISIIAVDKGTAGFSGVELKGKLCYRGTNLATLSFEDCRVPRGNLIGEEGRGLKQALTGIDATRIELAAAWIGLAQSCLDSCISYVKERQQFGKPIGSFQLVQGTIAEMAAEIDATRIFVYFVADLVDRKVPRIYRQVAEAKLLSTELATRVSADAIRLHGAYGVVDEYPVEHHYRDAIAGTIVGGTSNIQKLIIGRELLGIDATTM